MSTNYIKSKGQTIGLMFNEPVIQSIREIETKHYRFKAVTNISVDAATTFYCAIGRFPNSTEIDAIKIHGVSTIVEFLLNKKPPLNFDLLG
ncbi:MAG TPA: hypothetical protein VK589_04325 [Chryseolinea sp.]|nr:hypothetical protein [Chryseolinea sp.]